MYKDNFVVSIKVNDKFIREVKDAVEIPFGSEYVIYLKNLNDLDAAVQVAIDGKNIYPDKIHVKAKDFVELKGNADNFAFKFIEKTGKISNHRGDRAEDGLLTVTYQFVERTKQTEADDLMKRLKDELERLERIRPWNYAPYWRPYWYYGDPYWGSRPYWSGTIWNGPPTYTTTTYCAAPTVFSNGSVKLGNSNYSARATGPDLTGTVGSTVFTTLNTATTTGEAAAASWNVGTTTVNNFCSTSAESATFGIGGGFGSSGCVKGGPFTDYTFNAQPEVTPNVDGITVAGNQVGQHFEKFKALLSTDTHTITLKLMGKVEGRVVQEPVYTKTKLECATCGTINGSDHKFCKDCGTNLRA